MNKFYTFKRGNRIASRLDRIYASRDLLPCVKRAEHKAGIGVDHTHGPVVSLSAATRVRKGQETWRMNNSAMNNAELLTDLSELIINMTNTLRPVRSAVDTWLCIKKAIKGTLRRHGIHKANLARDRKLRLK